MPVETISHLPVLVLYPHSRCNCRCVMCDIWKVAEAREISREELERHGEDIARLRVEWVVFSGGEPLMHRDVFRLSEWLRGSGIRTTLLTTGLLLERHASSVASSISDVIVSLDGPPRAHDAIRRTPGAYARLAAGVRALREAAPGYPISARCTVQRANHTALRDTVRTARALELDSISFLAADVTTTAFERSPERAAEMAEAIGLAPAQAVAVEAELEALIRDFAGEIESGFVRETPAKLRRIAGHFRALLGQAEPVAPRCNAPWVSAVWESDGTVRPCFFHPPYGNLAGRSLEQVLNSPRARAFRQSLDVAQNPVCRRCVCSLEWKAERRPE